MFSAPRGRPRWLALLAVNVAAVIFGSTALFGKLALSPLWIVAGRGGFAALALLAVAVLTHTPLRLKRPEIAGTIASGVLLASHWVTFYASVQLAGVAVATLTFATFPLMTILIESILQRRTPSVVELTAGLTIVLAVSLLVAGGLPAAAPARLGAALGLLSAVAFAGFSVLSQRLGTRLNIVALSLYQNAVVFLVLAPFLPALRAPVGVEWAWLATLGVIATAAMHQLYFFALKHLPASVCGGFVALEPVYAILFAALLFDDAIGLMVIVSGALIVGASLVLLAQSKGEIQPVP